MLHPSRHGNQAARAFFILVSSLVMRRDASFAYHKKCFRPNITLHTKALVCFVAGTVGGCYRYWRYLTGMIVERSVFASACIVYLAAEQSLLKHDHALGAVRPRAASFLLGHTRCCWLHSSFLSLDFSAGSMAPIRSWKIS